MSDVPVSNPSAQATLRAASADERRDPGPARAALGALREALANDGIRRLGISWTLGVAADTALVVVMLVTVFNRGGVVAAGLVGAVRMVPAVISGMFAGTMLERFRGDRILVALGLVRAMSGALAAFAIATAGPSLADHATTMVLLFLAAAIAAGAGAPVRPTQVTLMPAIARSPRELVAANTAWSTGEGLGAFGGPFIAGVLCPGTFGVPVRWFIAPFAGRFAGLFTGELPMRPEVRPLLLTVRTCDWDAPCAGAVRAITVRF